MPQFTQGARWTTTVLVPSDPIPEGAVAFQGNVGFQALSVAINNLTGYWIYIPEANEFIPPWWVGVVRNPVHSTDYSYIQWRSPWSGPQTITTPGPTDNPGLYLMFTDYFVPYNSGSLVGGTGAPASAPPINITIGPTTVTAIANAICDCINIGGGVTPHGAKVVIYNPTQDEVPNTGWATLPCPTIAYDTDGYSDGVGVTIPAGRGGWYWVGFAISTSYPANTDMYTRITQVPPTLEPIGTPQIGDEQLIGQHTDNQLRLGPFSLEPLYLPVGTSLYIEAWADNISATPNQVGLWIEQMPDRSFAFPVYQALSFPGVASSDGNGNTVGTLSTVVPSSTIYVDWQAVGGVPVQNGMALISVSLGITLYDSGYPNGTAPATHMWETVPAAPDWEIAVYPQSVVYEAGLTGSGRFYTIP